MILIIIIIICILLFVFNECKHKRSNIYTNILYDMKRGQCTMCKEEDLAMMLQRFVVAITS